MLRNKLLAVGAVIAGFMLPAQAMAQYEAYTRVDLNLRVGPATDYGVIDVIPYGDPVDVFGCLDGIEWCDVEWYGLRGWVAASYLVQPGTSVYLPQVYTSIGLPIISFSFNTYHDRYYRDRPWYKKRSGVWRGRDWRRGDRPKNRQEAVLPKKQKEAERPRQQRDAERPRQQQEVERPQKQQKVERPQKQQKVERPKKQQKVERPKKQQKVERPQKQQKAERPRQQEAAPRQGDRTQRARQGERSQGQRGAPAGGPQELEQERGQ